MAVDFSWTVSTGLQDMQLKIERDESDKRRGNREQMPASVSGVQKKNPSAFSAFQNLEPSHGHLLVLQLQCAISCLRAPLLFTDKCYKVISNQNLAILKALIFLP